jgi:hypothetical protein
MLEGKAIIFLYRTNKLVRVSSEKLNYNYKADLIRVYFRGSRGNRRNLSVRNTADIFLCIFEAVLPNLFQRKGEGKRKQ